MVRYISNADYRHSISNQNKLTGILAWLVNLDAKYRQRIALTRMTDEQLCDIGLDRYDIGKEIDAPFWDPPIQLR